MAGTIVAARTYPQMQEKSDEFCGLIVSKVDLSGDPAQLREDEQVTLP